MIGRLNHVAIAVPDLEAAAAQYAGTLGAKVNPPQDERSRGYGGVHRVAQYQDRIALPLGENSPIQGFSIKTPLVASTISATRWTISSPRATSWQPRARAY